MDNHLQRFQTVLVVPTGGVVIGDGLGNRCRGDGGCISSGGISSFGRGNATGGGVVQQPETSRQQRQSRRHIFFNPLDDVAINNSVFASFFYKPSHRARDHFLLLDLLFHI